MNKRFVIVALTLAAAIALALSVQGGRWWSIEGVEIGPFGSRQCFDGTCRPTGLGWIGGSDRWMRLGVATWAGGMLGVLLLVALAATVAARRVPRLLAKTTIVALATATLAGALFFALYPGVSGATVDRGALLFPIAIVLGAIAAVVVVRAPAPASTVSSPSTSSTPSTTSVTPASRA